MKRIKKLEKIANDYGLTIQVKNNQVSFFDDGIVVMDMEINNDDEIIPFARISENADESILEFEKIILGLNI